MKGRIGAVVAALAVAVLSTGASCSPQELRDLEGVPVQELEEVRIYANVNGYANVVVGCIEGRAFSFTTRDYEAVERQADLDGPICGSSR